MKKRIQILPPVLPQPPKDIKLPVDCQWLSGEGAGSWFHICESLIDRIYIIQRFSSDGDLECEGMFEAINRSFFDPKQDYRLDYPSHCAIVSIIQNESSITFKRIENEIN